MAIRLTPDDVKEIRRRYAQGDTQAALSRAYKMNVGHIGRIVRGETWQNVDEPVKHSTPKLTPEESEARFKQLMAEAASPLENDDTQAYLELLNRRLSDDHNS